MPRLPILLACVLAGLALWAVVPVSGFGAPLRERIAEKRDQIDRKQGRERVLSSDIAGYSERIRRLGGRIDGLRRRQATLERDLEAKRAELMRIQADLRAERARLARLRARLVVARRALAGRLAEIYKAEKPDALSVVLNARGFADLLERGEFIQRIADQDRGIVELVRRAKADAKATEARLDRLERRQQAVTDVVQSRRDEVSRTKLQLIGTRVGFRRTRADKAQALRTVREDRSELQEDLRAMEAQEARVRARLAGAGGGPVGRGSGSLIVPVSGLFTSPFGQRWGRLHAGIDIAAPVGAPIRAADSGRVVLMGPTGGYGNYTCVQHSSSMSTCYAHQVRFGTSMGANVRKGQVIGYVGNTGNSTGAHLHFEVRIGGSPVDPAGYL